MERLRAALEKRDRRVKKRIATRVPRRTKELRLGEKRVVSEKKRLRATPE